jgi:hypothetical protein
MALTKVTRGLLTTGIVDNSNATAITIDASENVGIGTSSPSNTLDLRKDTPAFSQTSSSGAYYTTLGTNVDYTKSFVLNNKGSEIITYGDDTGYGLNLNGGASNLIRFTTNATERLRIDSSGHAIIGGGVTLGNGQTYAAANTLDDYEEGTWTPAYTTGSHTYTAASTRGIYTKIGDCITFSGVITTDSLTQSGDHVRLSLPFTTLNDQGNFAAVSLFIENGYNPSGGAGNIQGIVTAGGTDIQLYTIASSAGNNYTQVVFNDLKATSGTRIRFSGHYYV